MDRISAPYSIADRCRQGYAGLGLTRCSLCGSSFWPNGLPEQHTVLLGQRHSMVRACHDATMGQQVTVHLTTTRQIPLKHNLDPLLPILRWCSVECLVPC